MLFRLLGRILGVAIGWPFATGWACWMFCMIASVGMRFRLGALLVLLGWLLFFPCEPLEPCARVRKELLCMCQLVRRTQSRCLAHCVSATCLVDKRNVNVGARRFRRLEIL